MNIPREGEFLVYLEELGALCVQYSCALSDEPVMVTLWWPIMRCSRATAECYALGHRVSGRDGRYGYDWYAVDILGQRPDLPESARRTVFLLENGEKTEAIKVEKTPVPMPKIRAGTEVRWKSRRWQKYLKTKGWVNA